MNKNKKYFKIKNKLNKKYNFQILNKNNRIFKINKLYKEKQVIVTIFII